ncbi:DedA family protein [Quadrisphaera sp. INWT6]|uniref:DedA family protein n=1 Tax=Quadrisphaera sp. INWT6 TaxID=2596917 RepID=UPI0018926901|nr:DedA family protein [Quadrisphaera sp. INWT6]MBF5083064.1 DedA family protein [Quadrisphaera sp. INWT6]
MSLLDPQHLLSSFGAVGLFVILFAETGLLIGFFLPGDSLLFTAGLLAATSASSAAHLPLGQVLVAGASGALLGAQVGYLIGRRVGPALLDRPDRPKLQAGVRRAQQVLDRYGHGRAVVLARFIPVVRTLMNPLAGTVGVPPGRFALWQVVGGLVWSLGVTLAGYVLGTRIPGIDAYLLPIIAVVVVVSLIPVAVELVKARREAGRS